MKLKELEAKLDESVEMYAKEVNHILYNFYRMDQSDQEYFLTEAIDNMNRQAFYAFMGFKDHIIEYLEELEKKG